MAKNQLTEAEIEMVRRARATQSQASSVGVNVEERVSDASTVTEYDTFIPITGLPSGSGFYRGGISGQPLKVEDLLLIQTIGDKNYYRVFSEIFARRIKGIDPHDILVSDEVYLALWLRANSYPGYSFPHDGFTCENPECGIFVPSESVEFGFQDMEFGNKDVPSIRAEFGAGDVASITLNTGLKVNIAMRRRKHMARVERILQRDYYDYGGTPSDELIQLLNVASVVSIGESTDIMDVVARLRAMKPIEFVELLKHIKRLTIPSDPTISLKCPVCGEVTQFTGYVFRPEFFLPIDE